MRIDSVIPSGVIGRSMATRNDPCSAIFSSEFSKHENGSEVYCYVRIRGWDTSGSGLVEGTVSVPAPLIAFTARV